MTYQANIPLAGDKPSVSQGDLLQNFIQINSQFGAEHNALDSPAHDGKHKFVTLQRSAGVPPAGTNMIIAQALTPAGNPYVQALNSTTIFSIPLTYKFTAPTPAVAASATTIVDLIDFATIPLTPQAGEIVLYDINHETRTLFSTFVWVGGKLSIPVGSAQLFVSNTFRKFQSSTSVLQLEVNGGSTGFGATNVSVRIIGTAI